MKTDAELIDAIHALLLNCLKGNLDADATVAEMTGLLEENGRPFIGSIGWPANEG